MKSRRFSVIAASVVAAAVLTPALPAEAASVVQIYRVYFDSPGSDKGGNKSLNGEWVQLKNKGKKARSLTGWKLRDKNGYTYKFGKFTLKAGATVKVRTGKGKNTKANRYWGRSWYVWNNTGDTAYLRTKSGAAADKCSWGSSGSSKYC